MTARPHWLCRLGFHAWEAKWQSLDHESVWISLPIVRPFLTFRFWKYKGELRVALMRRCTSPNCKRAEWEEV